MFTVILIRMLQTLMWVMMNSVESRAWAGEMDKSVKVLTQKHGRLSSHPQKSNKIWVWQHARGTSVLKGRDGWTLATVKSMVFRFSGRVFLKKSDEEWERSTSDIGLWPPHTHSNVICTCKHMTCHMHLTQQEEIQRIERNDDIHFCCILTEAADLTREHLRHHHLKASIHPDPIPHYLSCPHRRGYTECSSPHLWYRV